MTLDPAARLDELLADEVAGRPLRFVHFWGQRREANGALGWGCFSQWWESPFEIEGETYSTAEHWMMVQKARLFGDSASASRIASAASPGAAKAFGREVEGFEENLWAHHRYEIVVRGGLAKFGQNADLGAVLARTGDQVIVEASPQDTIWGIGLARSDPLAGSTTAWRGLNLLGFALMEVRDQLATRT